MKKLPGIPKLEQQEVHQYLSLLSDEKVICFFNFFKSSAMYCLFIYLFTYLFNTSLSVCRRRLTE